MRFSLVCLQKVVLLFVSLENLDSCAESDLPTLFYRNGRLVWLLNKRKHFPVTLSAAYCCEFV